MFNHREPFLRARGGPAVLRASWAGAVSLIALSGCNAPSSAAKDDSTAQARQAIEIGDVPAVSPAAAPSDGIANGSPAPNPTSEVGNGNDGVKTVTRLTADGEPAPGRVPKAAPTVEAQEGEPCGATNDSGALLSCRPGTYCLTADGKSTCVSAARPARWDG